VLIFKADKQQNKNTSKKIDIQSTGLNRVRVSRTKKENDEKIKIILN
jgi:hypothetical protein